MSLMSETIVSRQRRKSATRFLLYPYTIPVNRHSLDDCLNASERCDLGFIVVCIVRCRAQNRKKQIDYHVRRLSYVMMYVRSIYVECVAIVGEASDT